MYLNILLLTLRFIATGWPSSYSTPDSPPSPERPDIFWRNSSSSSAWVLCLGFGVSEDADADFEPGDADVDVFVDVGWMLLDELRL